MHVKDLELHTIELNKFSKDSHAELADIVQMVRTSLDIWAAFLTRHDLLNRDHLPPALNDPALKKALGVLNVMNFGPEEQEAYEEHLKWLRVEANTLKKYEAKGFVEGKIEGMHEGQQIGIVKGMQEEKKIMACKLLAKGLNVEDVCNLTGLRLEDLKSLS